MNLNVHHTIPLLVNLAIVWELSLLSGSLEQQWLQKIQILWTMVIFRYSFYGKTFHWKVWRIWRIKNTLLKPFCYTLGLSNYMWLLWFSFTLRENWIIGHHQPEQQKCGFWKMKRAVHHLQWHSASTTRATEMLLLKTKRLVHHLPWYCASTTRATEMQLLKNKVHGASSSWHCASTTRAT